MARRLKGRVRFGAKRGLPLLGLFGLLGLVAVLILWLAPTAGKMEAMRAAEQFLRYEQAGNFGSAWELFGDELKTKYTKDIYIQRKSHVFMQDFGVNTFKFQFSGATKLTNWRMSRDSLSHSVVYKVPASLHFNSVFGTFDIHQDLYAYYENQQWRILWEL